MGLRRLGGRWETLRGGRWKMEAGMGGIATYITSYFQITFRSFFEMGILKNFLVF